MPSSGSAAIPALRYDDAPRAIDWLQAAFGFKLRVRHDTPDGKVAHAQLVLEEGMVMLSSHTGESSVAGTMLQPAEAGNRSTVCVFLVVTDAVPVYAGAQAAGATIVHPLGAVDYGGKAFGCQDFEGHLWWIGEYNPWEDRRGVS